MKPLSGIAAMQMLALLAASAAPWTLHAAPASQTAQATEAQPAPTRPKIGLVLAGGGAKGAAHVGVLKVLEEMKIPIDFVVGTSMGSIIGGLYASGMSPQQIEQEINSIDWTDVFIDAPTGKTARSAASRTTRCMSSRPSPVSAKAGSNCRWLTSMARSSICN